MCGSYGGFTQQFYFIPFLPQVRIASKHFIANCLFQYSRGLPLSGAYLQSGNTKRHAHRTWHVIFFAPDPKFSISWLIRCGYWFRYLVPGN